MADDMRTAAWSLPWVRQVLIDLHDHMYSDTINQGLAQGCSFKRVLSKQWQGEFCRCSINVVGGKQCDGGVDHLERFRDHTGPSAKAGKPVAQPAVDPLNRHCFILPDIMPPNRQERVVRRIIVCTVQRDAPGFCYAAPALLRSLSSAVPATGSAWRHHDCHIPSR